MSQEKVDRYKEEKKNRAKNMKKARIRKVLIIFLVALVLGAAIGFPLGKWIYDYKKTHVKEEDVFISSFEYKDWFDKYWVENYSDLYTGSELKTESETTTDTTESASGSSEDAATETPASSESAATEAPSTAAENTESNQ